MKTAIKLAAFGALLFSTTIANAEVFKYPPGDDARVAITFPDDWEVKPQGELLHAYPKDGSIYFGFLPIPENTDSDKISEVIGGAIDSVVTDLKESQDEIEPIEVNGIKLFVSDATGKDKDTGNPMNVSIGYFSPDDNPDHMMAILYFGTDEAQKKHEAQIQSVITSIKNPHKS